MSQIGFSTLAVLPSFKDFGPMLTKGIAPELAAAGKTSGMTFGKSMAAGIASTALIGIGVITGLGAIGKTFHDMSSTIRVETGKSGTALDGLVTSAKNVGRQVPSSFGDIGKTVAGLNVRLGLTGPVLETLTRQFLVAGRITKQSLDMNTVTGSFNAFNIKGADTTKALDNLFRISQATGVGINELAAATSKGAPAFRQFGLSFSDSAALVGVLDKAGINSGKTIAALTIGLTKFAKEGKAPAPALRATIEQIQAFTKSGNDAAAIKLAASIFGTRGASQFVAAVKSGKVNLDDMMKSTGAGKDTILEAGKAVSTFGSKWSTFKNNVLIAVEPIATRVFKAFGDGMQFMNDTGLPALQKFGAALSDKVAPVLKTIGDFIMNTALPAIKNFITEFQNGEGAGGKFRDILATIANFITGTVVPTFVTLGKKVGEVVGFFKDHDAAAKAAVVVLGGVMTAITAAWVAQAAVATINAVKTGLAWIATATASTTASTIQSKSTAQIVVGWVLMGAKAAFHAAAVALSWVASTAGVVAAWALSQAETFAIWLLYLPEAIGKAATTAAAWVGSTAGVVAAWVIAKTGMVAEWLATAGSAAFHALAVAASWVASVAGVVAVWATTTAAVIADWVAMKVASLANAAAMAGAWLVAMGPVGWVLASLALVAGAIYLLATKTTYYQTVWHAAWETVSVWAAAKIGQILTYLGWIVDGAAAAFAWVPTLGPKLAAAAAAFHKFHNDVVAALAIPDKTISVGVGFHVGTGASALNTSNVKNKLTAGGSGYALGGPVTGGIKGQDSVLGMLMPNEFIVRADGSNLGAAIAHFGGVPGYAKGGLVLNTKFPSAASINAAVGDGFGAFVGGLDFSGAIASAFGAGGGGAGGAAQWAGLVSMALMMLGQPASSLAGVLRLINKESGGNPNAINLTDSNAMAGHPSQGLMQTIPGTFAAYAGAFAGRGITDPFANIYAGMAYAIARYGSIAAVDPLVHAGGYANGTNNAAPGYAWVGERGPELVHFGGGEQVTPNNQLGSGETRLNRADLDYLADRMAAGMAGSLVGAASSTQLVSRNRPAW